MGVFTKLRKEFKNDDDVVLDLKDPTFWIDSGNFIINKILGGDYRQCFAQGRIGGLAGPSGAGKSFLAANVVKYCLKNGIAVLYLDTENAIDKGYFEAVGIDPEDENLQYVSLSKISSAISVVQKFLKAYRADGETAKVMIVIDSLDMMKTDSEAENYDSKGTVGGDQGQQAKQLKRMLQAFVQDIKRLNVSMLCTKQVYKNQDPISSKQEPWLFTEAIRFAFSNIAVVTRLFLKDKETKDFKGMRMKVWGLKTRFTQPYQQCEIEVPYSTGMNPYSGTLKAAESLEIVQKNGGWYIYNGDKFYEKDFYNSPERQATREAILEALIAKTDKELDVKIDDAEEDLSEAETPEETTKRRVGRKVVEKETEAA